MAVTVHEFEDTGEAYDAVQSRDDIKNGDVLVVQRERVVGIVLEAWPVAITPEAGAFHTTKDEFDWSRIRPTRGGEPHMDLTKSLKVAQDLTSERGFDISGPKP